MPRRRERRRSPQPAARPDKRSRAPAEPGSPAATPSVPEGPAPDPAGGESRAGGMEGEGGEAAAARPPEMPRGDTF
jgi:hypothetical protein